MRIGAEEGLMTMTWGHRQRKCKTCGMGPKGSARRVESEKFVCRFVSRPEKFYLTYPSFLKTHTLYSLAFTNDLCSV